MAPNITFEDEFISLCEWLGENSSTLINHIGQCDDLSTNDHGTRFMYYDDIKTDFCVDRDNTITGFKVPLADAEGNHFFENSDHFFENSRYYSINGICLGMTHNEIRDIMGDPDIKSNKGNELDAIYDRLFWNYSSNVGYTKSGNKYIIRFVFDDREDEFILTYFMVDLLEIYTPPIVSQPKTKSGCFVATACYGDYNAAEVIILRDYRDNVLLKNKLGKVFVRLYYLLSPQIANLIEQSNPLKVFVRKNILSPIVLKLKKKQK